jgi:hypothetical protein
MAQDTPAMAPSDTTPDTLVPDPVVAAEFGVTLMTLWRWTHDPKLEFPAQIKIRRRNFRSRRQLEQFKYRMLRTAIGQRADALIEGIVVEPAPRRSAQTK